MALTLIIRPVNQKGGHMTPFAANKVGNSTMSHNDTIAPVQPHRRGSVGILRILGLKARRCARGAGKPPKPRYADHSPL